MSSTNSKLTRVADNIRILSAAMVEKAKSGHPGGAMGGADFVTVLYTEFLRYDPDNMAYPYRDRFFLDPGHMSPMLYSVLSLAGYYTTEDLQSLRQWGSVTPGHPEVDVMRGVENTSGPLGQGHAMALGAAIAERFMAARFGEWMAHKTYAYISDGAVEEEISQGVGRIAGHLGLSNFIMYYDSNNIQLSTKVDEVLPEAEKAVALAADCDRIQIALAPHSPYTVSPENLRRGKELARKWGLHFMTHIAETQDEVRIVREKYAATPVEHLDALGMLDDKTIGAHCIHVTDSDIRTLAQRGVAVSHNPQSNMKISSGVAPVEKMRAAGALVTIGTDGTCSNNDLDMFEELRTAAFLQKSATGDPVALPAYEALKLATVNGARAMGYAEGELGVIRPGALADLIVVDLQKPHLQPIHDLVSNLVYCGKASDVDTVVVDGRIVVENRRVAGVDLPKLYADVAAAVERITGR